MSKSPRDEDEHRGPGRPTVAEQKNIRRKIFRLFKKGHSAAYIIQNTKYDKDTVYKYQKEYLMRSIQDGDDWHKTEYEMERQTIRLGLEDLMVLQKKRLTECDKEIREYRKSKSASPKYLLEYEQNVIHHLGELYDKRQSLSLVPSLDQIMSQIARGKKNGKR